MRIRHTAATITLAALAALTACTPGPAKPDATDPKPAAKASASAKHTTAETAFLLTTRTKIPALEKLPDEQLLDLGRKSCDAIDAGNTPAAVAAKAEEGLQIGAENSGYIVGAAVSQFCPEHKSKL